MKVGDLVRITTAQDPPLVGSIALIVGHYKDSYDVFNIHFPSQNQVRPYHITRLEKLCSPET
jgi:hypothetical protein